MSANVLPRALCVAGFLSRYPLFPIDLFQLAPFAFLQIIVVELHIADTQSEVLLGLANAVQFAGDMVESLAVFLQGALELGLPVLALLLAHFQRYSQVGFTLLSSTDVPF